MASAYSSSLPNKSAKPPSTTNAPQGTFLPGTKVQVGSHRVVIERYLSEGGFAHVYVVRIPRNGNKYELAVLKRVAVPDKEHLTSMRTEVETMKKLKGHKHIVTYIDSHASQLNGGGYEVFLLMEFCSGGGLIDFMNTRLQHRLTEPEILKIFADVAEGLACMHYLKPPLLHRDLKVENVLISKSGKDGIPLYKLADFGSTAPPRPAATTAEEGRLIEDDVQKHTTMQYRSPEMIDVWRKRPIDEKADIWAMGVFLYKLCYYTTPFEEVGQMAILNASFKFPAYPQFSDRLKRLISAMLKEDSFNRPNIYQVIKEVCSMRGTEVPVKDIYSERTHSEARRNEVLPSDTGMTSPKIGLQRQAQSVEQQVLPDIVPMRRGRPTTQQTATPKPSLSPAAGDPFAALDSKNLEVGAGAVDELSKRFPSLDDFAIAHDRSEPFQFSAMSPPPKQIGAVSTAKDRLNERVTAALADEAFAAPKRKDVTGKTDTMSSLVSPKLATNSVVSGQPIGSTASRQATDITSPRQAAGFTSPRPASTITSPRPAAEAYDKPLPSTAKFKYVSTATGTSPPDPNNPQKASPPGIVLPKQESRPIWKVPSNHSRSTSQPRASPESQAAAAASLQPSMPSKRPSFLGIHRSKSSTSTAAALQAQEPEQEDHALLRTQTAQTRPRPSSSYISSNLDFLRDQENARKSSADHKRSLDHSRQHSPRLVAAEDGDFGVVENDVDFLQDTEAEHKNNRKGSGGLSFGHRKRNSLPSISGATKDIFKGRFGDALKRFEPGSSREEGKTPTGEPQLEYHETPLSPIAGSETLSKHSDDAQSIIGDAEELPADVRREMERRRLSQEERRVAEAAREYRERVTTNGTGAPISRGTAIQQRVQTLLDEGSRSSSPVKRTAEGYGRFTDAYESDDSLPARTANLNKPLPPIAPRKPSIGLPDRSTNTRARPAEGPLSPQNAPIQAPRASRPSAPPKPKVLRTQWSPESEHLPDKPSPAQPSSGLAALLAKDLEGVPDYPSQQSSAKSSAVSMSQEDLEAEFSRRYPSLSGIEMVETDLGNSQAGRTREI
ncbi:hypothetical protein AMS68_001324 [Peltaster fructicola]|uniref:non-specific serine/threonine protein kinase n=1 Tax=Peltaster fructicola TaxID=286661 RepID=A0A6H0XM27_9PEZI|nr:hypothetical protein AMS68_001324 [Peltaster fructicola]